MWLIENYQTDFIKEKRFNEKDNFFVVWNFQYRIIYDKFWECLVKVFYKQKFFTTFTYIYWDGSMFPFERKLRFHLEWFNKSFEIKKLQREREKNQEWTINLKSFEIWFFATD